MKPSQGIGPHLPIRPVGHLEVERGWWPEFKPVPGGL